MEVKIDLTKTLSENANDYYEKAKKIKNKIAGAEKALTETLAKLKDYKEKEDKEKKPTIKEKKTKKWFEAFRWFISSENFLVVGGKDATSNEVLIKKYTSSNDLVFHSDIFGSPFYVIKDGIKAGEKTQQETARICASYSRAWKDGLGNCDVYCVKPEQVSKTPKSGEFLSKGSFMIYGERKWFRNTELKIYLGFHNNEVFLSGSSEGLEHYACITPGNEKAREIAEKIRKANRKKSVSDVSDFLNEEIIKFIPYGSGHLIEVK